MEIGHTYYFLDKNDTDNAIYRGVFTGEIHKIDGKYIFVFGDVARLDGKPYYYGLYQAWETECFKTVRELAEYIKSKESA